MSLFDDASLVLTPNGYKASKLYSIKPTSGLGDMTVVRATTARRVNSAGLIESVATNVPRLDYTGGGCPKILVEPLRTNVILHSGDLSQSVWSKSLYVLTSATSIQGLTTTRITKNSTNNGAYNGTGSRNVINTIGTFASGTKTLTWLIRKGNTDKVGFLINNVLVGALTSVICEFNFTTQTFTNVSLGLTASFENPTTDVYKIILTINDIGVGTSKAIWIAPIDNSNNTVTGGYLDFAFAQWELGSNATSYIPTVAATVTRNADVISNTGISSLINSEEGVLFFKISNLQQTVNTANWITLSDSTTNATNYLGLRFDTDGTINYRIIVGGVMQASITTAAVNQSLSRKIAIKWKVNNFSLYIDGLEIGSDLSGSVFPLNTLSVLRFNFNGTSNSFFGKLENLIVFPTALTNAQLATLTTI